jgi:hypothetical protein
VSLIRSVKRIDGFRYFRSIFETNCIEPFRSCTCSHWKLQAKKGSRNLVLIGITRVIFWGMVRPKRNAALAMLAMRVAVGFLGFALDRVESRNSEVAVDISCTTCPARPARPGQGWCIRYGNTVAFMGLAAFSDTDQTRCSDQIMRR